MGRFDSALCNAVLEHVEGAEQSMRELARVVRKGGHIVVAVPFLQPHHACPGDFRRYTADGLAQLGRNAGLEVVDVLPVHSAAQTFGWLLWEVASEQGGFFRRRLAWLVAFLITRIWNRTDKRVVRNANTFQAVFRRPDSDEGAIIGTRWRSAPLPQVSLQVPTMLVPDELRLLMHLAQSYYEGRGVIVDAGSFLGGSTIALAEGLKRNDMGRKRSGKVIHSFDRFEVEEWTRGTFFPETTPAGADFRDEFLRNIAPYADVVEVHAGDITNHRWNGEPIELLFIDVAKHWTVCDAVTWEFFPHLIPGRSLVVQQDYLYHHWVAWLHVTMEFYADYFEYVCDTEVNSVLFRYVKKIPESVLRRNTVEQPHDRGEDAADGPRRKPLQRPETRTAPRREGALPGDAAGVMSDLPYELLMKIQQGTMAYRHRGVPLLKNPFDLALYPLLLERARPRTLIEIGSYSGGSALWFADSCRRCASCRSTCSRRRASRIPPSRSCAATRATSAPCCPTTSCARSRGR